MAAVLLCIGVAEAAWAGASSSGLGAGSKMPASCGAGMTLVYAASFDASIPGYAVNGIDLSNIPAGCLGKELSVTFYDKSNNEVGSAVSADLPASGTTESIPVTPSRNTIGASLVTGVSVVVS